MGKGATSEAVKYIFRAANVRWGVRSILLLPLVARCLETIYVCIWRMLVFMSVVVTVLGSPGNVCCVSGVVEDSDLALEY